MTDSGKAIHVELDKFGITVSEAGTVVRTIYDCSFGRHEGENNLTPVVSEGALSLWKRKRDYKSATYPEPNGGAPMNFALFLEDHLAVAFHEGSTSAQSHGCIHLSRPDAKWLFEWAGASPHASPVSVSISGPHPRPGVRATFYAVGESNMLERVIAEIRAAISADGGNPGNGSEYDDGLASAVTTYQAKHGIKVDGKVGTETALRMGIEL